MSIKVFVHLTCVSYLSKPSMVQFKAVIFGSSSDNDEHKAKLVNPSYENPGYIDADDDDQVRTVGFKARGYVAYVSYETCVR